MRSPVRTTPPLETESTGWRIAPAAAQLRSSVIRDLLKLTEQPGIDSFAGGLPAADLFPVDAIRAASERILRDDPVGALQYGPTEGYLGLREQIAARLSADGTPTAVDEVLITTGSQQGLDLIGRALLSPGAPLLAADPSYLGALQAFALQQPQVIGFDPSAQPAGRLPAAAFAYLTPTFANPTGTTLGEDARRRLGETLAQADIPLVEDDPYRELWFDAPPPVPCRAHRPAATLYLGSFSKVLTPGLRVGYVAGPAPVIALLARLKQACDLHTPALNQRIVAQLMDDGTLDRHLPVLRQRYQAQRDALHAALRRHLDGLADWALPSGGMFLWLTLRAPLDTHRLLDAALARRVAFVPGSAFALAGTAGATLRLAFSTMPAAAMDAAAQRLRDAILSQIEQTREAHHA